MHGQTTVSHHGDIGGVFKRCPNKINALLWREEQRFEGFVIHRDDQFVEQPGSPVGDVYMAEMDRALVGRALQLGTRHHE